MRFGVLHDSCAHGPEVLDALAEPDAPQFAEKLMCLPAAADRHDPHTDAATTLRVCILVEYSVTLAVCWTFLCKKKRKTPLRTSSQMAN